MMEEEKREPVSDIDTGVVVSLKVLDPDGRLEKRTSSRLSQNVRVVPKPESCTAARVPYSTTSSAIVGISGGTRIGDFEIEGRDVLSRRLHRER